MRSTLRYAMVAGLTAGLGVVGCGGDGTTDNTTSGPTSGTGDTTGPSGPGGTGGGGTSSSTGAGTGGGGTGGGGPACTSATECNDNSACTTDACLSGSCSNTPIDPNDNDACTVDACDPTAGVTHAAINVDDNDACTIDACNPVTGVSHAAIDPNDNNACTVDACDAVMGVTHTAIDVNDNNACTIDACSPVTGVSHAAIDPNDNNACTIDACDVMTGVSHTAIDPNDNNICTIDACSPATGVSHTPVVIDDNNACTTDACDPITGVSHTPVNPNDNNACTIDACDPVTGVSNAAQVVLFSEDFSDNNAGWTLGQEWQIGGAQASSGGQLGADPAQDHTPTADNGVAGVMIGGNASTVPHGYSYLQSPPFNGTAVEGEIVLSFWRWLNSDYAPFMHNRVEVWDGAQWQILWLSGETPGIEDSPSYGNGWTNIRYNVTQYANAAMRVRFGFDVAANAYIFGSWNVDDVEVLNTAVPTDNNLCTADVCDPATGVSFPPANIDEGNLCTTDACDPARQVSHVAKDCSALSGACAAGSCNPATGQCQATPTNEGLACDDGNTCTLNAKCTAGVCSDPTGPGYLFYEDFADNSAGWTLEGLWSIGPAVSSVGCAGCGQDPSTDHTATADNGVAGIAIGGCSDAVGGMCLVSPGINTTQIPGNVWLDFWRHGHLDYLGYASNRVEVWNGTSWVQLYVNDTSACVNDIAWTEQSFNVTAYKNVGFRVRFCSQELTDAYSAANWTIDDVTVGPNACTP